MHAKGESPLEIAPETLVTPLTYPEAANAVGVEEGTVRSWVSRGILKQTGINDLGRPTFRWIDVARAERQTRDKSNRRFAA